MGPQPSCLDHLEPFFSEDSISARRASSGALALEQIRYSQPDLLLIDHPLPDMPTDGFVGEARSLVDHQLTVVVFAPTGAIDELSPLRESGETVLPSDGSPRQVVESASIFLRKGRRSRRTVMVHLGVSLGDSQILRFAQTANLSQRGMLVRTSEQLPLGSEVRFELMLPPEKTPIRGMAEAVRYTDVDKEKVRGVGVRFVEFEGDGEQRLREHLNATPD